MLLSYYVHYQYHVRLNLRCYNDCVYDHGYFHQISSSTVVIFSIVITVMLITILIILLSYVFCIYVYVFMVLAIAISGNGSFWYHGMGMLWYQRAEQGMGRCGTEALTWHVSCFHVPM